MESKEKYPESIYKGFRVIWSKSNVYTFNSFHVIDKQTNKILHYICIDIYIRIQLSCIWATSSIKKKFLHGLQVCLLHLKPDIWPTILIIFFVNKYIYYLIHKYTIWCSFKEINLWLTARREQHRSARLLQLTVR